jgi:glycosyltransferase involved in cell wall biosynthesis
VPPVVTFVSFRFGGTDGVSVEADKWARGFEVLGYTTRRVAGAITGALGPGDVVVPGLALDGDTSEGDLGALVSALDGSDLVVVENICSLPVNAHASRVVVHALERVGGRIVFHHHDLPWQRRAFSHFGDEFPPRLPGAVHVTINQRSRRELGARGFERVAVVVNRFDFDAPPGNRAAMREHFGFADDELVVLQPTRAIERKNVPGALRFTTSLARVYPDQPVRYWLSGPPEDGYGPTLDKLLAQASTPVTVGRAPTSADAYAASDVVVLPSTWEGFGNPTIESIAARRPLAVFAYPVLAEIAATGLRFFSVNDPGVLSRFLRDTPEVRERFYEVNLHRARLTYSLADLPADLERLLHDTGSRS